MLFLLSLFFKMASLPSSCGGGAFGHCWVLIFFQEKNLLALSHKLRPKRWRKQIELHSVIKKCCRLYLHSKNALCDMRLGVDKRETKHKTKNMQSHLVFWLNGKKLTKSRNPRFFTSRCFIFFHIFWIRHFLQDEGKKIQMIGTLKNLLLQSGSLQEINMEKYCFQMRLCWHKLDTCF